jgi:hypothetical protein
MCTFEKGSLPGKEPGKMAVGGLMKMKARQGRESPEDEAASLSSRMREK